MYFLCELLIPLFKYKISASVNNEYSLFYPNINRNSARQIKTIQYMVPPPSDYYYFSFEISERQKRAFQNTLYITFAMHFK